MAKIDWQKDMKNAMWSMFWLIQNAGNANVECDKESLKENVARLIRMSTQKTAGQKGYAAKNDVCFDALEHTMMTIVCAATSLALAGEFGKMPEYIDE